MVILIFYFPDTKQNFTVSDCLLREKNLQTLESENNDFKDIFSVDCVLCICSALWEGYEKSAMVTGNVSPCHEIYKRRIW